MQLSAAKDGGGQQHGAERRDEIERSKEEEKQKQGRQKKRKHKKGRPRSLAKKNGRRCGKGVEPAKKKPKIEQRVKAKWAKTEKKAASREEA